MYSGLALVAIWLYIRFPGRRPESISRALAHVVLSFGLVSLLPVALLLFWGVAKGRDAGVAFIAGVMMPTLCYLLLSWLWLLGRVVAELGGGTPRGGHPVPNAAG